MKVMDFLDRILVTIAMISLFIIMVVVGLDGLGRHFFNAPIKGAYVLVEKYLMVAMIFLAIGYTWAKKGHIGVTLFYKKMPIAVQNIAYFITLILGLGFMGIIGYTGFESTYSAFAGHHVTSGLIRWPLWLAYVWVFLGALVFCLRLILEFVTGIYLVYKNGFNQYALNPDIESHESAD